MLALELYSSMQFVACANFKHDLDPRNAARSRRNPGVLELPKENVVLSKRSLTLED
jgi:hypothetical protein